MRRLFLFAILTLFLTSCASTGLRRDIPEHQISFFDESPVGQSRAYREYKMLAPGERARISYLLWRMEYSPLKFWRNGSKYKGREGAGWLRWKMRKFYPHVNTADGFINEVASRSENSQIPYKIYCLAYDCPHNLRDVLLSELHALEEYELKEEEVKVQEEALKNSAVVETEGKQETPQESATQIVEEGAEKVVTEKNRSTITAEETPGKPGVSGAVPARGLKSRAGGGPGRPLAEPVISVGAIQPAQAVSLKAGEISAEQPEDTEGHSDQATEPAAPTEKSF